MVNGIKDMQTVEVTWKRVMKVWWSIFWRIQIFMFPITFVQGFITLFIGKFFGIGRDTASNITLMPFLLIFIVVTFFIIKRVLRLQYSDFRIALIAK